MFIEDDEAIQERVKTLLREWPHQVDFTRFFTGADPFVVARAPEKDSRL